MLPIRVLVFLRNLLMYRGISEFELGKQRARERQRKEELLGQTMTKSIRAGRLLLLPSHGVALC